ncbi:hypothetical protein P5673_018751, partial [Acropora cervicornis]
MNYFNYNRDILPRKTRSSNKLRLPTNVHLGPGIREKSLDTSLQSRQSTWLIFLAIDFPDVFEKFFQEVVKFFRWTCYPLLPTPGRLQMVYTVAFWQVGSTGSLEDLLLLLDLEPRSVPQRILVCSQGMP